MNGPASHRRRRRHAVGRCDWFVTGTAAEVPERSAQAAVLQHVRPCHPPTLLVRDDVSRTGDVGVSAIAVYLPFTDHTLDFTALAWSTASDPTHRGSPEGEAHVGEEASLV